MKRILTLILVMIVFTGCVSNKAFRKQEEKLQSVEAEVAQNEEELVVLRKEIMQTRRGGFGDTADAQDIQQLNLQLMQNEEDMKTLIHEHLELSTSLGELSNSVKSSDQTIVNMINDLERRIDNLTAQGAGQSHTSSATDTNEKSAYERARDVYYTGNYTHAITQLDKYLADYPNSQYAGNAVYWKGESQYAMGNMQNALREFQTVISRYPKSWKIEDAQLKIGMCYQNMGDHESARTEFNKLKRDSPQYYRMDLLDRYMSELK